MRSCVYEVTRQDIRSREIDCRRSHEIQCLRCREITHPLPRHLVSKSRTIQEVAGAMNTGSVGHNFFASNHAAPSADAATPPPAPNMDLRGSPHTPPFNPSTVTAL